MFCISKRTTHAQKGKLHPPPFGTDQHAKAPARMGVHASPHDQELHMHANFSHHACAASHAAKVMRWMSARNPNSLLLL